MKIAFVQPPYPNETTTSSEVIRFIRDEANNIEQDTDLLVLPEYTNCPGVEGQALHRFIETESADIVQQFVCLARQNKIHVAMNIIRRTEGGLRNTTIWIDRAGEIVAEYDKTHLTEYERVGLQLIPGNKLRVIAVEGYRIAFATCFELYFAEYFASIAARRPDLIVVPTYQRSEHANILLLQARMRAIDCGSHLLRCSYSMGADSATGGASMLVDPTGEVICQAGNRIGTFYGLANLDMKRLRPMSFGQPTVDSRVIMEQGRRSSLYAGVRKRECPHPSGKRIIAHRGYSTACPENTMPAFGAAVASGAEEIELDIHLSKDNELVIIHDPDLDRTTDRTGFVRDALWRDMEKCDAGSWHAPEWRGTRLARLEDVFRMFAHQVVINIHIKHSGDDRYAVRKVKDLAYQYDNIDYIYIAGDQNILEYALEICPEIERCCLEGQNSWRLIDHAVKYKCSRLQFFNAYCNRETIQKAHDYGMYCNLFYCDTKEEAEYFYASGIDAILTNTIPAVQQARDRLHL